MSVEFIEQFCVKNFKRNPKRSKEDVIKRLTHLHMNGRHLEHVGDLSSAKHLKVLYLHNNCITRIPNLNGLKCLTHLHLQWNRIKRIENLNTLSNLRKLYLGHNEISRLEGMEHLHHLEELHLERQTTVDEFSVDANSLQAISRTLRVLNISWLRLKRLDFVKELIHLERIISDGNEFFDANNLAESIAYLPVLISASFLGCPAQRQDYCYRNKLITASKSLAILDSKEIHNNTRSMLERIEGTRANRKINKMISGYVDLNLGDFVEIHPSGRQIENIDDLSKMLAESMVEYKPWKSLKIASTRNPFIVRYKSNLHVTQLPDKTKETDITSTVHGNSETFYWSPETSSQNTFKSICTFPMNAGNDSPL